MKIIVKIAKNELRYLFYSPIAWFVMIVFWVVCAAFYTGALYPIANMQDIYLKNSPGFKAFPESLTLKVFLEGGVFNNVITNLYFFIPILTMGLISREVIGNTVKLLYSSPVSIRQIVLGKYLGIILYNLLVVAIMGVFIGSGIFNIRHVDYGLFLSAITGFYLLVCAYSAIGLFMSTLSTYQILSALGTFMIIFLLGHIGGLWQRYDLVRDLTWWLSLQNRTTKMLQGLLVTRDIIYFVIVSAMFVAFTLIKLQSNRQASPWYVKAVRYAGVVFVALVIIYTSSRPMLTRYLDTTATQRNTIPERMQKLIRDFGDSSLEITLYANLLAGKDQFEAATQLGHCLPEARNTDYMDKMWERYQRFKPDMAFNYEYYYDNDAKATDSGYYKLFPGKTLDQIAAAALGYYDGDPSMFKSPAQMHTTINLQPEGYRAVMQLKYRGRTEFLRTYDDPQFWPDYIHVAAACKRLLHPEKIPKIYFITGDLERNILKTGDREYAFHTTSRISRPAIVNIGFDVDTLNLQTQDIPSHAAALVLADPKVELSATVLSRLSTYIAHGGNMLIMGEPGKQYVLNPFLRQLGVQLRNGQLVEPSYDETPDKILPFATQTMAGLSPEIPISPLALMPGATALTRTTDNGFAIKPLLQTIPDSVWLKAGDLVIDSTLPPFHEKEGDVKERTFNTAVDLTRQINNKQQRIIVYGDADLASNQRISANYYLLLSAYSWMGDNEFPIYMQLIAPEDTLLKITADGVDRLRIVYIWILPGILLALGAVLLIRRKRK